MAFAAWHHRAASPSSTSSVSQSPRQLLRLPRRGLDARAAARLDDDLDRCRNVGIDGELEQGQVGAGEQHHATRPDRDGGPRGRPPRAMGRDTTGAQVELAPVLEPAAARGRHRDPVHRDRHTPGIGDVHDGLVVDRDTEAARGVRIRPGLEHAGDEHIVAAVRLAPTGPEAETAVAGRGQRAAAAVGRVQLVVAVRSPVDERERPVEHDG